MQLALQHLYWPTLLFSAFLPGAWIGCTAHDPLLVAIAYRLIMDSGMWLLYLLPPPAGPTRFLPERWLFASTLLLGSTLAGVILRSLLGL